MKHIITHIYSTPYNKLTLAIQAILLSSSMITLSAYAQDDVATTHQILETIEVTATENISENTQSYTVHNTNSATKLNLSPKDTPQTVKVLTRQYLDDHNIKSYQDLVNTIAGVSTHRTDERQSSFARGFQVDYYMIDGLQTNMALGEGDFDMSIFDRVEVVKGASGLMTGAGNPAMGLNFVRKHANAKQLTGQVSATLGSWDSYSSTVDLSTPLNKDGSLRGRAIIKHSDENSFMDFFSRERNIAYGAIDYDVNDKTSLSFAVNYQQLKRDGIRWGGLPAFYTDGTRTNFNRSLTVSSDWTYWDVETLALFTGLKQNLFDRATLNLNYGYRQDDKDSALLYYGGRVNKATNLSIPARTGANFTEPSVYAATTRHQEHNIDTFINIPFTLANREQEIILGSSWGKMEAKKNQFGSIQPAYANLALRETVLDFSNMNTHLTTPITTPNKNNLDSTTQSSYYLASKWHLLEPLKIVAGARLSNWRYKTEATTGSREFKNQLTPYIGIIFDLNKQHSVYASYTDMFKPQNRREQNGNYLDPIMGKQYETGIKSEWLNGHLNSSLSLYRIEQDNVAERIDGVKVINSTEDAYRGVNGVTSKGIELSVDGKITEHFDISFDVTRFEAKDAKGNKVNTNNSRTSANIFAKYSWDKFSIGGGVNYRSKFYTGIGANRIDQNAIVLANLMANYQFTPEFSTQLNIENLFDKTYYEGIGSNAMNYGSPRYANLTFKYKF